MDFDILLDYIMIYARHVFLTDVSLWFVNKRKTFRGSCQLMLAFILFQVLYIRNGSNDDLGCLVNIKENLNTHQRTKSDAPSPNDFHLGSGNRCSNNLTVFQDPDSFCVWRRHEWYIARDKNIFPSKLRLRWELKYQSFDCCHCRESGNIPVNFDNNVKSLTTRDPLLLLWFALYSC